MKQKMKLYYFQYEKVKEGIIGVVAPTSGDAKMMILNNSDKVLNSDMVREYEEAEYWDEASLKDVSEDIEMYGNITADEEVFDTDMNIVKLKEIVKNIKP